MGSVIGTHVLQNPGGPVIHVPPNGNSSYSDYAPIIDIFEMGYVGAQSGVFSGGVITTSTSTVVTGNGTTDDGPAINAAIAALAGTGRTLYFPAGTFKITTAIVNTAGVPIEVSPVAQFTGTNAASMAVASGGTVTGNNIPFYARAVQTTVVTSTTYTGTTSNTLTFGSHAIGYGTQDGITTLAVGDCIMLQGGTLGSCAITACDTGPWIISVKGTASVAAVLTRPTWWQTGSIIPILQQIQIGPEGSLFGGTKWTSWASTPAAGVVIGATGTDAAFYPDKVQCIATLASSAYVLNTIPFRSFVATSLLGNTTISVSLLAQGGTSTSTCSFGIPSIPTAGYLNTATATINALTNAQAKNGTSDNSVLSVVVVNRGA